MLALIKIRDVLIHPIAFWSTVEKEQGIGNAMQHFLITSCIAVVVNSAFVILSYYKNPVSESAMQLLSRMEGFGVPAEVTIVLALVILYVTWFVATFLNAISLHLFAKLFGGSGSFSQTYKAITYGMTPALLFYSVPILYLASPIYTFLLQYDGLQKLHKLGAVKTFFVYVLGEIALLFVLALASVLFLLLISST